MNLEKRIAELEQRISELENKLYFWMYKPNKGPGFTPGTVPAPSIYPPVVDSCPVCNRIH